MYVCVFVRACVFVHACVRAGATLLIPRGCVLESVEQPNVFKFRFYNF